MWRVKLFYTTGVEDKYLVTMHDRLKAMCNGEHCRFLAFKALADSLLNKFDRFLVDINRGFVHYDQLTLTDIQVNGFLSAPTAMTSGIRQGCPLAPLLFITALDVLYRAMDQDISLRGPKLQFQDTEVEVRVCGYADDTTIYLKGDEQVPPCLEILDRFGSVSGLQVNLNKSVAVPLSQRYEGQTHLDKVPLLQYGERCRYLGFQVGDGDTNKANWDMCFSSLRTRLTLARDKTHSVFQRAEIARTIIVPKILFVARYSWPGVEIVNQIQSLITNFVWGSTEDKKRQPWMAAGQAQLPVAQGGIGIPNASIELRTMSATTVSHWARDVPHYERLLGDIALSNARRRTSPYIMPSDISSIRDSDWPKTLWESGVAMMMTTHDTTGSVPTPQQAARCAEYLAKAYSKGTWDQGNFEIGTSHEMEHGLEEFIRVRAAESGTFCPEWLPHCPTQEDGWIRDRQGPLYKISGLQSV